MKFPDHSDLGIVTIEGVGEFRVTMDRIGTLAPTPPDAPCGLCGATPDDPDHGIGGSHAPTPPDALDVTAYRLRGTAMAVEKERKAWLRHSPQWTDEEVGSVIDRIADALRAALTQPEEAE